MAVAAGLRLDASPSGVLAVCVCGWRHGPAPRPRVLAAAAHHESLVHPGIYHARNALAAHRRRRELRGAS